MTSIVTVGDTISSVFLVESVVHAVRLIVEMYTSKTERVQRFDVVVFEAFVALTCVRFGKVIEGDIWCGLPLVAIAAQCAVAGVYEYAAIATIVFLFVAPCSIPGEWLVVIFTYLSLFSRSERSNILRVMALTTLFFAAFGGTLAYTQYMCVTALELASWATERYMMPWRIASARACCGYGFRFFIGFVVGVHILDGRDEDEVRLRPSTAILPTLAGVSVYGERAYLRYQATPLGVLFSYVEGLHLVPIRLVRLMTPLGDRPNVEEVELSNTEERARVRQRADARARVKALQSSERRHDRSTRAMVADILPVDAPLPIRQHTPEIFRVILFGAFNVADVDISTWAKVDCASTKSEYQLATYARYPFRRVLLGVLFRLFL